MVKYKKILIKIFTNIFIFIVAAIAIILLYNFIQLKILKQPYVNFFGYAIFEVVSGSMEPTINKKDIIIVDITKDLKVDDIITYAKEDTFVTHRVLDIQGNYYITRGDANNSNDVPIEKSEILGKVVKVIPEFGIIQTVFMTPKIIVSITITLSLFCIAFLYKSKSNKKKEKCIDYGLYHNGIITEYYGDKK